MKWSVMKTIRTTRQAEHLACSSTPANKLFHPRRSRIAGISATLTAIGLFCVPSLAQRIISVEIQPVAPITSSNAVSFTIFVETPQSAAQVYRPTEVVVGRNQILVVLYPTWGDLDALDDLTEMV